MPGFPLAGVSHLEPPRLLNHFFTAEAGNFSRCYVGGLRMQSQFHPGIARVGFRERCLSKSLEKEAVKTGTPPRVGLAWEKRKLPPGLSQKMTE